MKPTKPITQSTDPAWRYTPAVQTDVAATMRRVMREQERARAEQEKVLATKRIGRKEGK